MSPFRTCNSVVQLSNPVLGWSIRVVKTIAVADYQAIAAAQLLQETESSCLSDQSKTNASAHHAVNVDCEDGTVPVN